LPPFLFSLAVNAFLDFVTGLLPAAKLRLAFFSEGLRAPNKVLGVAQEANWLRDPYDHQSGLDGRIPVRLGDTVSGANKPPQFVLVRITS